MKSSMRMAIVCLIILLFVSLGCSNSIQILSHKNHNGIRIDGLDDDWEKQNMEVIANSKIAVGIANDEKYLYLGIAPLDRGVAMQMMITGFTVWFDSLGHGNKILGIRYPIGREGSMPLMTLHERGQKEYPFAELAKEGKNEIEIIGPGKLDKTRLTLYELSDIVVKLTHQHDGMFYELKVPLKASNQLPYGINAKAGRPISILLETGDFKKPEFKGGMPVGGRQRDGGMRSGGPQTGMRPELPKKMKVLFKTTLSAK